MGSNIRPAGKDLTLRAGSSTTVDLRATRRSPAATGQSAAGLWGLAPETLLQLRLVLQRPPLCQEQIRHVRVSVRRTALRSAPSMRAARGCPAAPRQNAFPFPRSSPGTSIRSVAKSAAVSPDALRRHLQHVAAVVAKHVESEAKKTDAAGSLRSRVEQIITDSRRITKAARFSSLCASELPSFCSLDRWSRILHPKVIYSNPK